MQAAASMLKATMMLYSVAARRNEVCTNAHLVLPLQAKQDKFKGAVVKDSTGNTVEELSPILVDKRNTIKPLDPDASLQDSVQKEPVLEFAAIFSNIKLLPTAVANAVPSHTSGAALAPPAAFQASAPCSTHDAQCHTAIMPLQTDQFAASFNSSKLQHQHLLLRFKQEVPAQKCCSFHV